MQLELRRGASRGFDRVSRPFFVRVIRLRIFGGFFWFCKFQRSMPERELRVGIRCPTMRIVESVPDRFVGVESACVLRWIRQCSPWRG